MGCGGHGEGTRVGKVRHGMDSEWRDGGVELEKSIDGNERE